MSASAFYFPGEKRPRKDLTNRVPVSQRGDRASAEELSKEGDLVFEIYFGRKKGEGGAPFNLVWDDTRGRNLTECALAIAYIRTRGEKVWAAYQSGRDVTAELRRLAGTKVRAPAERQDEQRTSYPPPPDAPEKESSIRSYE